jgi:hypothetical protein
MGAKILTVRRTRSQTTERADRPVFLLLGSYYVSYITGREMTPDER